jgi:hypothetical protein
VYYLYLFACIAYFRSLLLDDFKNLLELDEQEFEQQLAGNPGK